MYSFKQIIYQHFLDLEHLFFFEEHRLEDFATLTFTLGNPTVPNSVTLYL